MYAFTILGLPAHPLVVHGSVVFIPLACIAAISYVMVPYWRNYLYWPLFCLMNIAWLFAIITGSTGETLEHALPHSRFIEQHAMWADRLGLSMHILGASTLLLLIVIGYKKIRLSPNMRLFLQRALSIVVLVLALSTLALVGIVGHLGAKAAWHDSPAAQSHR